MSAGCCGHDRDRGVILSFCVLAMCVLVAAGCGSAARAPREPVSLPTLQFDGAIVLDVQTSFGQPLRMLFDTGASACVVSRDAAISLGLPLLSDARWIESAAGARSRAATKTELRGLTCGSVRLRDVEAVVLDLAHINPPIDGIVNPQAFAGIVMLDEDRGRVVVSGHEPNDMQAFAWASADRPSLRALVAGREVAVVLDSGATGSFSLPFDLIAALPGPKVERPVVHVDGSTWRPTHRLDGEVEIGGVTFEHPVVHGAWGAARAGRRVLRELGPIAIDSERRLVWLQPQSDRRVELPAVRGIGAALDAQGEAWVIRSITHRSPAESAGLHVGETIERIEGMRPDELGPRALADLLSGLSVIRLEMTQDGEWVIVPVPVVYIEP